MIRSIASALLALVLAGCASGADRDGPGRADLYLAVALETAVGSLISLEAVGALPPEGAEFIAATMDYGERACAILADPARDPDQKRLALTVELADERRAFDQAVADLTSSQVDRQIILTVTPLVTGARAALRIALTEEVDPARWGRPCASVAQLAESWRLQRPPPASS